MKKFLVNYADGKFKFHQDKNSKTGIDVGGFDDVLSYGPSDIDVGFYESNRLIFDQVRGAGYWLWKPYFIRESLRRINYGDYLFYCDSGAYFLSGITPLVDILESKDEDLMVFELRHTEREYTKRDAFVLLDCDQEKYSSTRQRLASFSLWRKSDFSMGFADEYLNFCRDQRLLTDLENTCGMDNYEGFKDHRHDQSIFSLLSKKYDIKGYRDPSQWGNSSVKDYLGSTYEQIIQHTRGR